MTVVNRPTAAELAEMRDVIYRQPSKRPGCARAHDETWDLTDPAGYALREVERGHWHVVAGPGMCGWYCTGGEGCMSWDDVLVRMGAAS